MCEKPALFGADLAIQLRNSLARSSLARNPDLGRAPSGGYFP